MFVNFFETFDTNVMILLPVNHRSHVRMSIGLHLFIHPEVRIETSNESARSLEMDMCDYRSCITPLSRDHSCSMWMINGCEGESSKRRLNG